MAEESADLRTAYRTLDPAKPLEGWELSNYYVQRPGAPTARLAAEIKERSQPYRAILTGQRGVGKTTELNWLKADLTLELVLMLDLGRVAARNAATALAFVTMELVRQNPHIDLAKRLENRKWAGLDFEVFLPPEYMPEVVRTFNDVKAVIQQQQGRDPVLLLDGWERVVSNAEVYSFMDALEGIDCSTILVTRLSVIFEDTFKRFMPDWDFTIIPAIPLFTLNRSAEADGWSLLKTALEKRTGQLAFTLDALLLVFRASGGMFRELVSTARHACLLADRAGKDRVTAAEAEAALREQQLRQTATLTAEDRQRLAQFAKSERTYADRTILEYVNHGRIVAYQEESRWFDVHPVLWPLVGLTYPPPPLGFY